MATNDIFMLKDKQRAVNSNEEVLNIYFFRQTSATGTALDLATAFEETWLDDILDIQCTAIQHTELEAVNLFTVDDFGSITYADAEKPGVWVTDMLPVFNALTFRLVRTSRDIRNGYKRIAGIPEQAQVNGLVTQAEYIVEVNEVAVLMAGSVSTGAGAMTWEHVVVKRIRTGLGTTISPYKYRLPLTVGEAEYSNPSSVLVNLFVRHQVSRGN